MFLKKGLMIGPKDELETGTGVLGGTMASILQHNLRHEVLDPPEVSKRWPGAFNLDPGEAALFETVSCAHVYIEVAPGALISSDQSSGGKVFR